MARIYEDDYFGLLSIAANPHHCLKRKADMDEQELPEEKTILQQRKVDKPLTKCGCECKKRSKKSVKYMDLTLM